MKLRKSWTVRAIATTATTAMLLGSALLGGAVAQEASSAAKKIIFTVGTTSDMVSPNPFKACCGSEYEMMFMNYDMLFNFGQKDLSPVPGLAQSYTHSDDYKTWTFKIRSGVKWSDGQPLTAADIAFTYNFILDNGLTTFNDYLPYDPKITAPDATTLVWKSTEPTFAPLVPPWVPIVPEHIWGKFDGTDAKTIKEFPNVPAVGSGPFHLVEWKEGQFWRMEANKDYWGGSPTIDEVVFKVYDNQEAMVQALKSGEIDFAEALIPTLFQSLKGTPNIQTHVAPAGYFDNLAYNFGGQGPNATNLPALHDVTVRQAIAYAIDRNAIVQKLMLGNGTPGAGITLPGSRWYWQPPADQQYTFDPAKANQMLDDAGYKDTNGDGIRNDPKTGDELEMDVLTINNLAYSQGEGKLIQGWLKDIGIQVNLEPVSESKAYSLWADGDFDAYIWDWGGDPDPDFITSIFTTHQCLGWSDGCYSNPQYDKMYEQQKSIFNFADRKAFIDKMQELLYEQQPELVLAYENDLQAYRTDTFTGYVPVPTGPEGYLLFGWGPWSYINLHPVAGSAASSGGSSGVSTGVWLGIAAAIIVVVGAVALLRRGRREEDVA
jgi:peptide/nickel transport system substrate-binding protein